MGESVGIYKAIEKVNERHIRGHAAGLLFRAEAAARGYVPTTPEWNISIDHILIDQRPLGTVLVIMYNFFFLRIS